MAFTISDRSGPRTISNCLHFINFRHWLDGIYATKPMDAVGIPQMLQRMRRQKTINYVPTTQSITNFVWPSGWKCAAWMCHTHCYCVTFSSSDPITNCHHHSHIHTITLPSYFSAFMHNWAGTTIKTMSNGKNDNGARHTMPFRREAHDATYNNAKR